MITPGVYNIKVQRRSDWSALLEFQEPDETAINLTGYTVTAQAWDSTRCDKYADFTTEYVDRPNGIVRLKLSYQQTTTLPNECEYDVLVIQPNGARHYWIEGKILADPGYTAVT